MNFQMAPKTTSFVGHRDNTPFLPSINRYRNRTKNVTGRRSLRFSQKFSQNNVEIDENGEIDVGLLFLSFVFCKFYAVICIYMLKLYNITLKLNMFYTK